MLLLSRPLRAVDGGWSRWTQWTECSTSCGNGTRHRVRTCTEPVPMHGGRDCVGENMQSRPCFLRHCPGKCAPQSPCRHSWCVCVCVCACTQWTVRGSPGTNGLSAMCRVEEESSSKSETRRWRGMEGGLAKVPLCKTGPATPTPVQVSALLSLHAAIMQVLLYLQTVDGVWTVWSNWTQCSTSCGNGTKHRERLCIPPQYGGKDCVGVAMEVQECFLVHCPVHCQWLPFSEWSSCSASCDGGTSSRTRHFVPAAFGGDSCAGDQREIRECNPQACPGM